MYLLDQLYLSFHVRQRLKSWTKLDWALVHRSPRLRGGALVVKGLNRNSFPLSNQAPLTVAKSSSNI
jgi:hypothetical protein